MGTIFQNSQGVPQTISPSNPLPVTLAAGATASGSIPYKLISANSTNATIVKAGLSQVKGIQVYNLNAAARFLKIYNKATAPTVGTDTPVKIIVIPGNTAGAGSNVVTDISLSLGLAFALTTGVADADTGVVEANQIVVNIDYL